MVWGVWSGATHSCGGLLGNPSTQWHTQVSSVAPIIGGGRLFVFMEPTSPKVHDLHEREWYALQNGVPDTFGTGGEFYVSGQASLLDDLQLRTIASEAAMYQPEDRYALFELLIKEARCNGYGDVTLPDPGRWAPLSPDPRLSFHGQGTNRQSPRSSTIQGASFAGRRAPRVK